MTEKSFIPNHLYVPTIEEMMPDDIRYLDEDMLFCDKADRQAYIYKKEELEENTLNPKRLLGRFGLMRVMSTDDNGTLIDGYIADLRLVTSPIEPMDLANDMPDDCEDAKSWLEEKPNYVALLAITTKAQKQKPSYSGDPRFIPQMTYLTHNTDMLAKRNETTAKNNEKKLKAHAEKTITKKEPVKNKKDSKKTSSKNKKK